MSLPPPASPIWYETVRLSSAAFCKLYFRFRVRGRENVPQDGPVMLVANHSSHVDPVLIGVASPRRLRFLARKTLFTFPLGTFLRSVGCVPLDRSGSALGGVKASLLLLRDEQAIAMFPEGTRSEDGRLQALKPGFATLARKTAAALVPVGIAGAFEAYPRRRRLPRPRPVALQFGEVLSATDYKSLSDKELIQEVRDRMQVAIDRAAGDLSR